MRLSLIVRPALTLALFTTLLPVVAHAQDAPASSSSSSSSSNPAAQAQAEEDKSSSSRPRIAQIETGGSSVTLETAEPLFDIAAALNACEYNADLDHSLPVRSEVRQDMDAALAASEPARASRDALCAYIRLHQINDAGLNVGQYVSLALYLSPPPELTPNVDETEMPPQAAQVVNVLPLLRTFAAAVDLHYIWIKHRAEYEAAAARVHDPMSTMILGTRTFLHEPLSTYDGRRFLVLLEPMLSPALTNARIYGPDYIIVTSPSDEAEPAVPIRLDQIRHIYLHYLIEPMVYSRGAAVQRIQPLLRGVADAPIAFVYKSDALALVTECLIKAIEAQMYIISTPAPARPRGPHGRAEEQAYLDARSGYDRETAIQKERLVERDEAQGWVLTGYFFQALSSLGKDGGGLRDQIAPMIYGMDVERETQHARTVVFDKGPGTPDPLGPAQRVHIAPRGMDLAERDLMQGKVDDAADLADKEMADPKGDHGRAQYILARIDLMRGEAQKAFDGFQLTLKNTSDPRTIAWCHIYLGRLYDVQEQRVKALAEYEQALAHRDSLPDTKAAAEAGIAKPFALPKREVSKPVTTDADDKDFDPTGKKEKEEYKPDPPK